MKVCGFSFVRNAIKFGYPITESIQSVLPLCDKFVVAVGNSDDGTLDLIKSIKSDKIEIIETVWDDALRKGGAVLAVETNKAFDAIPSGYDWCFYIQGDEVVHEKYHETIRREMEVWKDDPKVEGLLFKYLHFWGTYDYVATSRAWYRREIRIVRSNKNIRSFKDAQGFRINNHKLKVKLIDAYVYHYGWVKNPATMQAKVRELNKLWHNDEWIANQMGQNELYDYTGIESVALFRETHPAVMQNLINDLNWHIKLDTKKRSLPMKYKFSDFIEKLTGKRFFEYQNYRIV